MHRARERQATELNDSRADEWLNCDACVAQFTEKQRAGMACARVPEKDRARGDLSSLEHALGAELDECPGDSLTLPQVIEAARAATWAKDGLLKEFYEGQPLTRLVLNCVEVLRASVSQVERENFKEAREKAKEAPHGAQSGF